MLLIKTHSQSADTQQQQSDKHQQSTEIHQPFSIIEAQQTHIQQHTAKQQSNTYLSTTKHHIA